MDAGQIAALTGGELEGSAELAIEGIETVDRAGAGQLTFVGDAKHAAMLGASGATVALVKRGLAVEAGGDRAVIRVEDADLALAKVLEAMAPAAPMPGLGVHRTAEVGEGASIGTGARVGAFCVIGSGATVGEGAVLHERVSVMAGASVGAGSVLWPGVVVRERCSVGRETVLHANVVIGADGFGYRPAADGGGIVKIPQIGTVRIGDACELGAGACVDRAKFGGTEIGDGCKIDNLVQIGHNCRLGRAVIIAGHSALAGSVAVGDGVQIGGAADIRDHLTIGAGARIAGGAQVMNDVPAGETWAGSPAQEYHKAGREYAAVRQLPEVMKRVRKQLRNL